MGIIVNTKIWVEKAIKKHDGKYDYSLVDYKDARTKVKIICLIHGVFEQLPGNHVHKTNSKGCPKCANNINLTLHEFIEKASKNQDTSIYDFSKSVYKSVNNKITIICKKHGVFKVWGQAFINGVRCKGCAKEHMSNIFKSNKDEFIKKAILVHGNKYNYDIVNYNRSWHKINIICKIHGVFSQSPNSHLLGKGCPKCSAEHNKKYHQYNPTGWSITNWNQAAIKSKNFDSFKVYVVKCYNDNEEFYKIGRTFRKTKLRFKSFPYQYYIVKEFIFNTAKECFYKEIDLKRLHKEYKYVPKTCFRGMHECFTKIITHE